MPPLTELEDDGDGEPGLMDVRVVDDPCERGGKVTGGPAADD